MSGLLGSLGLDEVPADPNATPDGRYEGVIFKDEIVVKKDDTVHHVITYKVEDPSSNYNGAQRPEWFKLGVNPVRDETTNALTGFTPAMDETTKRWYKMRLAGLGLDDAAIAAWTPGSLVGKKVTFGTKKNGNFINVNFVELREAPEAPAAGPGITGAL